MSELKRFTVVFVYLCYVSLQTFQKLFQYDCVFWYNLRRNGLSDERTRHGACPVLAGQKWVANFWIHEIGQEFYRPCGLTPDAAETFVGDLK